MSDENNPKLPEDSDSDPVNHSKVDPKFFPDIDPADDSNLTLIAHARQAFHHYIEEEKDPMKQAKLREFLPYIDKQLSLRELAWFRVKAIQTADAAWKFAATQKEQAQQKKAEEALWAKILIILWLSFAALAPMVIMSGMGEIYFYATRDGSEVELDTYKGASVVAGKKETHLTFSHKKRFLAHQPGLRVGGTVLAFLLLVLLTLSRVL